MNHLESLVAEWYQFQGYFVRRNVLVGKRAKGGYECELDVVAFNPELQKIVHIETSLDTNTWKKRQRRFSKKFKAGKKYIPGLFKGITLPKSIEQVALLRQGGRKRAGKNLGGGKIKLIEDFMDEIRQGTNRPVGKEAISEGFPLLRTLQYASEYWK
jgi:hypothetical protein